jgi:hypothetical protein
MIDNEGADAPEPMVEDSAEDSDNSTGEDIELVPAYKFEEAKEGRANERKKRRELEKRLAEYERKEKEAAEARMREERQFEELLSQRDQELADIKKDLENKARRERENSLFDAVSEFAGIGKSTASKLLRGMVADGDIEVPETLDKRTVEAVIRKLKDVAPDVFKPKNVGGTPPQKGLAVSQTIPAEGDLEGWKQYASELGKRLSGATKR